MSTTVVDDTESSIVYSGSWQEFTGSSRQWESTVHATSQIGATATFQFDGPTVTVFGTIPIGTGVTQAEYSIDGAPPVSVSKTSGADAVYADQFFFSGLLQDGQHTLVITNKANTADLMIDRIEFLPSQNTPVNQPTPPPPPPPPAPSPAPAPATSSRTVITDNNTSAFPSPTPTTVPTLSGTNLDTQNTKSTSQPSGNIPTGSLTDSLSSVISSSKSVVTRSESVLTVTNLSTQSIGVSNGALQTDPSLPQATTTEISSSSGSSSKNIPIGAIIGAVAGGLLLFILLLTIFLVRRRKSTKRVQSILIEGGQQSWLQRSDTHSYSEMAENSPINPFHINQAAQITHTVQRTPPLTNPYHQDNYSNFEADFAGPSSMLESSTLGTGLNVALLVQDSKSQYMYESQEFTPNASSVSLNYDSSLQGSSESFEGRSHYLSSNATQFQGQSLRHSAMMEANNGIPPSVYGSVLPSDPYDAPPAYH